MPGGGVSLATFAVYSVVQENAKTQGAAALRDSILASAKQCCAIEGSYLSSPSTSRKATG